MGLRSLFSRSSDLEPGDTIEVLDESGDTVEATYEGKGKRSGGRVVVTYSEGRYEGMGQYVERERIVSKKAEPQPKDEYE
jgi:hypothetical protein